MRRKKGKILKVCLYGSESTGKTTLCERLAAHYKTVFVPEMARVILGDRLCVAADFPMIAYAQFGEVARQMRYANRVLICDTDLIVTEVYEQEYFGSVHQEVLDLQQLEHYDIYLLCDIDVPWVADNQRVLGEKRTEMHQKFEQILKAKKKKYYLINGDYEARFTKAKKIIDDYLGD
jgi:HTH-type transcriptional regulator, transcriptional repressor of NAD biosynthesis genes